MSMKLYEKLELERVVLKVDRAYASILESPNRYQQTASEDPYVVVMGDYAHFRTYEDFYKFLQSIDASGRVTLPDLNFPDDDPLKLKVDSVIFETYFGCDPKNQESLFNEPRFPENDIPDILPWSLTLEEFIRLGKPPKIELIFSVASVTRGV
jgi:hypothetical protein